MRMQPNLSLNINDVYLKLDISKSILKINTKDPKIKIEDQILNLSNIEINLDLIKFLNNTNSVLQIKVATKENSIRDLTNFLNLYSFNLPRFIIYNQIETGNITAIAKINMNKSFWLLAIGPAVPKVDWLFSGVHPKILKIEKAINSSENFDFLFTKFFFIIGLILIL